MNGGKREKISGKNPFYNCTDGATFLKFFRPPAPISHLHFLCVSVSIKPLKQIFFGGGRFEESF